MIAAIERFPLRDKPPYWFTQIKDACIKIEFISQRTDLAHQYGRRDVIFKNQNGGAREIENDNFFSILLTLSVIPSLSVKIWNLGILSNNF